MPIPAHMIVCEGDLYDTRLPDWSSRPPLRKRFEWHARRVDTVAQLKACLRAGQWTFPGMYPLFFIADDGESLSFEAVRENLRNVLDSIMTNTRDGWKVVACDVNYEDSAMTCSHTGKPIPSAYGDDGDGEQESQ